jgi:hypothetical protein
MRHFVPIPHADTASIALKGVIWVVSFGCIVTLTSHDREQSIRESRSRN